MRQVWRRNCSRVQPHSVATCGSSRPRRCPCSTTRPWRPIDDRVRIARIDRFERPEHGDFERQLRQFVGGDRRKARILAAPHRPRTARPRRPGRAALQRAETSAQLAARLIVTNTPDASGSVDVSSVGARLPGAPCADDRLAREIEQLDAVLTSVSMQHRVEACRTRPPGSRRRRRSRRRPRRNARTCSTRPCGRAERARRLHHRDRRSAAARDIAAALVLRILLEQIEQPVGIERGDARLHAPVERRARSSRRNSATGRCSRRAARGVRQGAASASASASIVSRAESPSAPARSADPEAARRRNGNCISSECSRRCAAGSALDERRCRQAPARRRASIARHAERRIEGAVRARAPRRRTPTKCDGPTSTATSKCSARGGLVGVRADRPGKHHPGMRRDDRADGGRAVPSGASCEIVVDLARQRAGGSRIPRACDGGWSNGHRIVLAQCSSVDARDSVLGQSGIGAVGRDLSTRRMQPVNDSPRSASCEPRSPYRDSIRMSHVSPDDVERVARLARLELTADEKDLFARQLAGILAYAEQIRGSTRAASSRRPTPPALTAPLRDDERAAVAAARRGARAAPDADLAPVSSKYHGCSADGRCPHTMPATSATPSPSGRAQPSRSAAPRSSGFAAPTRRSTRSARRRRSARWRARPSWTRARDRAQDLPLLGVPVALKDNICTRGMPTTAASRILDGYVPPYDATVVERLEAAGAVIVGKTNCDEFAMGSSTENSAFGADAQPVGLDRIPGRLERRIGGGGGRPHGAAGARLRHRRIDPAAGGALRRGRPQADLRPRLALRPDRVRVVARSDRPVRHDRSKTPRWRCSVIAGHDPRDATSVAAAGDDAEGQRGVFDRRGDRADLIERRRERDQAVARHAPVGRLQADDAAQRRGLPDRSAGVRAERERHQACGDRRRGSAARAAGNPLEIPRDCA